MTTQESIDHYGSIRALAAALGITPQAVYAWGDTPPELAQYKLQVITDGALVADPVAANG